MEVENCKIKNVFGECSLNNYEKCADIDNCIVRKNDKLKQTLQEIKEYCEEIKNGRYIGLGIYAHDILQKISEVEDYGM